MSESQASAYWKQYRGRPPEFWAGVREGVKAYAIWRDGRQVVGCLETPLKEVISAINEAAEANAQQHREEVSDPLHLAVRRYIEEAGMEYNAQLEDQIVQFIKDNALAILHTYNEVLQDGKW